MIDSSINSIKLYYFEILKLLLNLADAFSSIAQSYMPFD